MRLSLSWDTMSCSWHCSATPDAGPRVSYWFCCTVPLPPRDAAAPNFDCALLSPRRQGPRERLHRTVFSAIMMSVISQARLRLNKMAMGITSLIRSGPAQMGGRTNRQTASPVRSGPIDRRPDGQTQSHVKSHDVIGSGVFFNNYRSYC